MTLEPFAWDAWAPGAATVTLEGIPWEAWPLSPSPPTLDLTAPLTRGATAGGVALYFSGDGSRAAQFTEALFAGAAGMIRVTTERDEDGTPLVEVGHTLEGSTLPAVAVDIEVGAALRRRLGVPVTLTIASSVAEGHLSENVVARVPGQTDQWVAVVAHVDSWHLSECAADNALGTAMLVQLGAMLARLDAPPERGVLLLATAGEEQGLQGAIAWTAANDAWVRTVSHVITLDIPWSPEGDHRCAATNPDWAQAAAQAMDQAGLPAEVAADGPAPASDHLPFQTRGAEALWCSRQPYRGYHTLIDTLDRINMDEAAASAAAHWAILAELIAP